MISLNDIKSGSFESICMLGGVFESTDDVELFESNTVDDIDVVSSKRPPEAADDSCWAGIEKFVHESNVTVGLTVFDGNGRSKSSKPSGTGNFANSSRN